MLSRVQIVGLCIVFVASCVVGVLWCWHEANVRTRRILQAAEDSFVRETNQNIPLGSEKSVVQQYIVSRNMKYSSEFLRNPLTEYGASATVSEMETITTEEIKTPLAGCYLHATFG